MSEAQNDQRRREAPANQDALRAIEFLALKSAVFILVPMFAAAIAVYYTLNK